MIQLLLLPGLGVDQGSVRTDPPAVVPVEESLYRTSAEQSPSLLQKGVQKKEQRESTLREMRGRGDRGGQKEQGRGRRNTSL